MVRPTDHADMDIGEAKMNRAAFVQQVSAMVTNACCFMGCDEVFSALQEIVVYRPEIEKLVAALKKQQEAAS